MEKEYTLSELFEMLKQDKSLEEDEQTRMMITEALKGFIINVE